MNRPAAHAVITTGLFRHGLGLCAAAALLAGCGGSQLPLSASPQGLTSQQSLTQQAYHIIHPFGRSAGDGTHPVADLIDVKGTLYGTTISGGSNGAGTVFSITTSGQETVLHSFGGPGDGVYPQAALLNVNGTLYGTTYHGGKNGFGTVFSITTSGTEKVLHDFDSIYFYTRNEGSQPSAGLIDVNGTLYGTTEQGGTHYCNSGYNLCGTVFSIAPSGKFKVLHDFGKDGDGFFPEAPLLNLDGTLYGTTSLGGEYNKGTVFSISTSGNEQVRYSFGTGYHDGANPLAALINVNGTLYGTTKQGGSGATRSYTGGTVFGVTPDGVETVSYSFNGSNGSEPVADLKNVKGVLYGTTTAGGANNAGTVFKFTRNGKETVLHSFAKGDGVDPEAGVIAVGGTLYGTAFGGGYKTKESGNVFSLMP